MFRYSLHGRSRGAFKAIFACGLTIAVGLGVASCANLADGADAIAGLGTISEDRSTFSDAKIVRMEPAWVFQADQFNASPVKIGAYWTGERPDEVVLSLKVDGNIRSTISYEGLYGLDVNIGGSIQSFKTSHATDHQHSAYNTVSKTIYTSSTNSVVISMGLLEEMVSAPHCRLRFVTSRGNDEADFAIDRASHGAAAARLYMKEFLQRVKSRRTA
jgi:hypothetical protein